VFLDAGRSGKVIDRKQLRREVEALRWFHQIDFGDGLLSPGDIRLSKIERTNKIVFGRVDVAGKSLLDIGCWDGAYSIEAVRRGASRVLATDHYVWHHISDRKAFELARGHLAPSIEARDIDVPDISVESVGTFDIVLFLGVFYHLRHPFEALERVAKIAKECLIVESRLLRTLTRKPIMRFYPGSELDGDPTNWWAPNRACIEAMLHDLGFRKILFKHPDRRWRRGIFHAFR
jgi:tRNA (mo5U34)-methyltransferase